MKNTSAAEPANNVSGGGKMTLRKFYQEYKSEIAFGLIMSAVIVASYYFAQFIPEDIFENCINPVENICMITVCLYGAWIISRHIDGNRLRQSWMVVLLVWAAIGIVLLVLRYGFGMKAIGGTPEDPRYNLSLTVGNILAWLLFIYPTQVLRPEWLTWKKVFLWVLPMVAIGIVDYYLPVNLIYLIMLFPAVIFWLICRHIQEYRQWCEDHYSSHDNIDVQWVVRYLVILLLLGVSFYFIGFWYLPNRIFTQQWLLIFLLGYSTGQILYRKDPWQDALHDEALQEEISVKRSSSLSPQGEGAGDAPEIGKYKKLVEQWMESEKPYLNPDFQLIDLRAVLPMNRTYLSRFVHEAFDCSFYQFVTNYRIAEAKRLMREKPNIKMQEVAEQSGFSSLTVFGRIFARETGMTPSEWKVSSDNS